MALVRYVKKKPVIVRAKAHTQQQRRRAQRLFFFHRFAPFFLVGVGLVLLASVALPILSYEVFTAPTLRVGAEAAEELGTSQFIRSMQRENLLPTPRPTPQVVATELDYTDLSNWFPSEQLPLIAPQEAKKFLLSIPKVGIEAAEVVYGGKNLDQHLIQYPGTASPGDFGSPVIFGHSVLRQFYNPALTNPRRYISIFSTIMTLKKGDLILLEDDGVTYRYRVASKMEVKPEDRFILEQQLDSRQLKLVTCVPEGTYLRRGVITAVLEE